MHALRSTYNRKAKDWGLTHLHDDHSFLYNVADSSADEFKQNVDAAFGRLVDLDRSLADGFDTPANEVNVDLLSVPR